MTQETARTRRIRQRTTMQQSNALECNGTDREKKRCVEQLSSLNVLHADGNLKKGKSLNITENQIKIYVPFFRTFDNQRHHGTTNKLNKGE